MTNFTKKFAVSFFPTDYQNSVVQGVSLSRTWYHQLTCTALGSEGSNFITNARVIWLWTPRRQLTSWAAASGAPTEICSCIKHGTAEIAPLLCQQAETWLPGRILSWRSQGSYLLPFPISVLFWHMKLRSKYPHVRLCISLGCYPCWFDYSNSK